MMPWKSLMLFGSFTAFSVVLECVTKTFKKETKGWYRSGFLGILISILGANLVSADKGVIH